MTACQGGDGTLLRGDGIDGPVEQPTSVPGDGQSEFVSQIAATASSPGLSGSGGSAAGPEAPTDNAGEDSDGGAERAISEADILQLSGDRLYALSRFSGLTIIDVSNPSALRLEGTYRSAAEPFEMYVDDGIVYAMFNSWYSYECDTFNVCSWQSTSRMQALDARDPRNIVLLADEVVPGTISDSRRVGDILYLATQEWGYCWGCDDEANATLTSFDVSDVRSFEMVDQLRLPGGNGGDRSISVTNERIYIAGPEYDSATYTQVPSTVRVVDISDPSGALVEGDAFSVAGTIYSRWQMDEHDGVFRVVSQPGGWGTSSPPVVETFDVNSSSDVQPLGSLDVQLPRPNEILRSVRFDGARAYAITAEQQDPLFTFDLSNPASPVQLGELEMPGWVYHMEPRGNRVFALGYDPQNPEGSLHVSLFDVTNLAEPLLLSRVAFGGDWGSFAEGQNQIHKAFSILPDAGLILVPFSGGTYDEATCEYDYGSGIQLVDFTDQSLTRRGIAPQVGNARRALLHRERLFGIGDNTVQTFDISNRDNPVRNDQLDVARNVSTVRVLGEHLMRFGNDWATNQTILDITPVAQASTAEPMAEIDLSRLFGADAWSCSGGTNWGGQVFTRDNYAYVPRYSHRYDSSSSSSETHLTFYIVDLSNRSAPVAVGSFSVAPALAGGYGQGTEYNYFTDIVQTDNTLLIGRRQGTYSPGGLNEAPRYYYDVLDLSNPRAPQVATRFEVPEQIAGGGWGYFAVGCSMDMGWGWYRGWGGGNATLTDGDLVISQHSEPVPGSDTQVKYYLDRIDVSDPYRPRMLPEVNIPGTAVHFNAETSELVTVDYEYTLEEATDWQDCSNRGYYGQLQYREDMEGPQGCSVARRSINSLVLEGDRAVRRSQLLLDRTRRTQSIAVSDSRIFYTTAAFPVYRDGSYIVDANAPTTPVTLESLRLSAGELSRLPSQELRRQRSDSYYGWSELLARGDRAFEIFDNTVTVVDTADAAQPARLQHELPGWGCQSLEVADDRAFCAVGYRGVEVIDLSSMR